VYNKDFDVSQDKVVHACRVHIPNEHASLANFEERVIVSDVQRNPPSLVEATKAYAKAMSSSVKFLVAENEHMAKELQATREREEKSTGSARA